MNNQIFLAFFTYFLILLTVGIIAHRKQTTSADFIMGNRSLSFWLTALSAHASDMSAWLFLAFPGAIFFSGMSQMWIAGSLLFGMFLNWQLVAKKLRTSTEKFNSFTLPSFFETRFQDTNGVLRIITASISLFFLIWYLSAGLMSMGVLFESIFGINYYVGITVAVSVVVLYTFFGGFLTVAWTDFVQAIFLLFVIILVPAIAFFSLPHGWASIQESAASKEISLSLFNNFNLDSFFHILFLMTWGLGYFGQPHIITKFMGIKDPAEMNKSKYVGMTWQTLALSAAAFVGLVGIAYFPQGISSHELVFVDMVKTLFPPFIGGFIICGIFAANMSTMDSQILVCASVFSEDVYKKIIRPAATDKEVLKISRLGVVVVAVIALSLAFYKSATILDAVRYAWSGLGCSFGPLVLMSLYSKMTNRYGAVAGILTGGIIAGSWGSIRPLIINYDIPPEVPGYILGTLSIYFVSILTKSKESSSIQACNL